MPLANSYFPPGWDIRLPIGALVAMVIAPGKHKPAQRDRLVILEAIIKEAYLAGWADREHGLPPADLIYLHVPMLSGGPVNAQPTEYPVVQADVGETSAPCEVLQPLPDKGSDQARDGGLDSFFGTFRQTSRLPYPRTGNDHEGTTGDRGNREEAGTDDR